MPRRLLLLVALLLGIPAALSAQAVRGTLRSGGSGAPVPGAHVQLRDVSGRLVASGVTDAAGGFLLRAPAAGSYTVSAERIGFARAVSPLLSLAAGETLEQRLEARPQESSLEGIVVRGGERARCRTMPPAGEPVHTVWEAARRALQGTESAAREGLYRYSAQVFERDIDPRSATVRAEQATTRAGMSGTPFTTVPLQRLAEKGYMEEDGDSLLFHAPDAAALLSDAFLEQHCFRLQAPPSGDEETIGLAFEPVRTRRLPDIEGVLWLDRASSELRRMEYRYTGLDSRRAAENAGGEMEFRRLPSGDWIVSRWRIRMPLMGVQQISVAQPMPGSEIRPVQQWTLLGVREKGGELTQVARRDGSPVLAAAGARLAGMVYDSTRRAGLAGARVWLSGTEYAAHTDSAGRYELADLPEGRYTVSFGGARLDSLGYAPAPVTVTLARGATTRRDLAVPPPVRMLAAACSAMGATGADSSVAGSGILVGVVRQGGTDAPLAGARVTLAGGGRAMEAKTDARGAYRFCGAPAGPVAVRVEAAGALVRTTLQLEGGPVLQDFTVAPRVAAAAPRPGQAASARAVVTGRVLGGPDGAPLAGARVVLGGGGAAATTDAQGRFTVRGVVAGSQDVTVAHPAHGTRTVKTVVEGGTSDLELRLGEGMRLAALVTTPYTLDPLRVEASRERRSLDAVGFYDRRRMGWGVFLTEEDFRRGAPLSSVIRTIPGIRVIRHQPPGRMGTAPPMETRLVSSRSNTSVRLSEGSNERSADQCFFPVFLDGVRIMSDSPDQGQDIDRHLRTGDVVAIEVYRNGAEVPPQYRTANLACGVVLLWTQAEKDPGR
ncbi:MAG: carboxypeptidase regulatory-like domain-containing protein [Longimicrobiaceae bacterium]